MGINIGNRSRNRPQRAWYPSGPWIGEPPPKTESQSPSPEKKKKRRSPNPDPENYKIEKVQEEGKFLIIKIHYPDCTNFEGRKILVFRDTTLVDLINQKYIDPHFFQDEKFKSPVARFVPTDEGWEMAVRFARANGN